MPKKNTEKTPEEKLVQELTKNNEATIEDVQEDYRAYEVVNIFIVNGISITGIIDMTNDIENDPSKLMLFHPHFIEDGELVPYDINSDTNILPINTACIWSMVRTKEEIAQKLIEKVQGQGE